MPQTTVLALTVTKHSNGIVQLMQDKLVLLDSSHNKSIIIINGTLGLNIDIDRYL